MSVRHLWGGIRDHGISGEAVARYEIWGGSKFRYRERGGDHLRQWLS